LTDCLTQDYRKDEDENMWSLDDTRGYKIGKEEKRNGREPGEVRSGDNDR